MLLRYELNQVLLEVLILRPPRRVPAQTQRLYRLDFLAAKCVQDLLASLCSAVQVLKSEFNEGRPVVQDLNNHADARLVELLIGNQYVTNAQDLQPVRLLSHLEHGHVELDIRGQRPERQTVQTLLWANRVHCQVEKLVQRGRRGAFYVLYVYISDSRCTYLSTIVAEAHIVA